MAISYPNRFTGPLLRGVDYNSKWDWLSGSSVSPPSYTIYSGSDGNYWARNGKTGLIDFTNASAASVIQSSINNLNKGGLIFIKAGSYKITTPITVTSTFSYGLQIRGEGANTMLFQGDNANLKH